MAGPFQAGDIVAFGKLAWEVYQYGFADEANATKQYTEFGRDVKGLAGHLDILTDVVGKAESSLRRQGGSYNVLVRWDLYSLKEIVGDYDTTLRECYDLIRTNNRYGTGTNVVRNLEWNALVQPTADRLRERIILHNSKIAHFLKPFEIDLLCRVREDIQIMHHDLANRIHAVQYDLHRLMGVLVPDLETELQQRQNRQIYILQVPEEIAERFRFAALADRPEYTSDDLFQTCELSDAFILNLQRSTKLFESGMRVTERFPPIEQYLNLLKCVWLFQRIRRDVTETSDTNKDSHWPSYVRQLEDDLSSECTRFQRELLPPAIDPSIPRDLYSIWPERDPVLLVDVVTRDEMMEQVLETPLESADANVERHVKLLRRMGSDGRRYRIAISGSELTASGKTKEHTEVIDFDISSVVINPHYVVPTSGGLNREIILHRDERIARLSFTSLKDVLKFQQSVTGFKAWNAYCEYNVLVGFVVAGLKDPIYEYACVQLWIPKTVDGSLVTNNDLALDPSWGVAPNSRAKGTQLPGTKPDLRQRARGSSVTWSELPLRGAQDIPSTQRTGRSPTVFSQSWPRQTSPGPIGSSPPKGSNIMPPPAHRPSLPNSPQGQSMPPWSRKGAPTSAAQQGSPPRSKTQQTTSGSTLNIKRRPDRAFSMFSNGTAKQPAYNSHSSGDSHTLKVSTGYNTTGLLLRAPPKPQLVMFTQSQKDGRVSFVSVDIDEETAVNPERCHCPRAGNAGTTCRMTALERRKGRSDLGARRFETSPSKGGADWNLARLARDDGGYATDDTKWSGLKRVSLMFVTPEGRAQFGGMPNQCQCRNRTEGQLQECIQNGHRGLVGEVQQFYRQQVHEYNEARYEGQEQVVNGLMS